MMATGLARGAKARGKRIAFGNGERIIWDQHSADIFKGNGNIAMPGSERDADIEWLPFYKGHRIYNTQDPVKARWIWNTDFRPIPGQIPFNSTELRNAQRYGKGFVLIEPEVPMWKAVAPNKDWGLAKYQALADRLRKDGHRVAQFVHPKTETRLDRVDALRTLGFRDAVAILQRAALYVGSEGGLHHGAAAVGRRGVVLFGGFIPPSVTGYDTMTNLTGGAEACGNYTPCDHCKRAMAKISVEEVHQAVSEMFVG